MSEASYDGTTFHLDELGVAAEHGRWGLRGGAEGDSLLGFLPNRLRARSLAA